MTKTLKFPKGYLITVNTYENDDDNNKTKLLIVDTIEQVRAIVELLKKFKTASFANCYDFDDDEEREYRQYKNEFDENYIGLLGKDFDEIIWEAGITDTEWRTRRVKSYTVEYLEEDVYVYKVEV